jgi:hypothetical protein
MPPPPQPRPGQLLRIKNRPLEFSFWPMERTTRRYGLGTRVFATDPWTVIRRSAERRCLVATRDAAFALLEQAHDFYRAAASGVKAAKPLLLYYCLMNLGKAFVLTCRQRKDVNSAMHGLSEKLDPPPNDRELINAFLNAERTVAAGPAAPANQKLKLFDELHEATSGVHIAANQTRYDLPKLMPQVVPGHRLWVEGDGDNNTERFVSVERIAFVQHVGTKQIWLRLFLCADDLRRINISHQEFLVRTRLNGLFREVHTNDVINERPLLCFEQINTTGYNHRPSDEVPAVVTSVRHLLWRTVLSTPPYRKYYLYAAPTNEHLQVLPQVLSIYAITFYLGSIVRYRPHHFDRILADSYGPFIEAFMNDQPSQFIYLMASEFAEKEVTKAAIV